MTTSKKKAAMPLKFVQYDLTGVIVMICIPADDLEAALATGRELGLTAIISNPEFTWIDGGPTVTGVYSA